MKRNAPLSAEDKLAIQESIYRASFTYSDGDVAAFMELFDDDATFAAGWTSLETVRLTGREALGKWLADVTNLYWSVKCSRVWIANIVSESSGDGAHTMCFFHRLGHDGMSLSTGTWAIDHRKRGDRWLITSFRMSVDGSREEFAAKQALAVARARHGTTAS